MANEIQVTQDFQTKLFARIREQMGNLLSDDDMRKITHSAVERALFEKRYENEGPYSSRVRERESLLVELVRKEIEAEIPKYVASWFSSNQERVAQIVSEQLSGSVERVVIRAITSQFEQPLQDFAYKVEERFQKLGGL